MTGPRVVLLESDAARRVRLETLLVDHGFDVRSAPSLAGAARLVADDGADLLIANLVLDDGAALSLAKDWVRGGRPMLGISDVFYGPTSRQILKERLGLMDVLETPFDDDELLEQLDHLFPATKASASIYDDGSPAPRLAAIPTRPARLDMKRVPLKGKFEQADIATVLARLASEQRSGALMIQAERVKKLVYLDKGVPVGIKSNLLQECLGQMLVQEGQLSAEACDRSVDEMRRTRQRQGEVLMEMGHLTAEGLEAAMGRQFFLKFQQLFTWTNGEFRYKDAPIPSAYHGPALDDPANLIWNGIDHTHPVDRVRPLLEPVLGGRVGWSQGGLDIGNLTLSTHLRALYPLFDEDLTGRQVLERAEKPDRALLLLYALTAMGAIAFFD